MMKRFIKKILFPNTYSSEAYCSYLRKGGANIGKNVTFISPRNTIVDEQRLPFISIGEDSCITSGVVILAHDWSYSVVARVYNDAPAKQETTMIGKNVFIGMNAIVLMGSKIGDNVIVGAGSVVHGKLESNAVYAGNPAKKICTLDEYYKKLSDKFEDSTSVMIETLYNKNGQNPTFQELGIFSSLFVEKTEENMNTLYANSLIPFAIKQMPKKYESIDEFRRQR